MIRWGVLSTARIAEEFHRAVADVVGSEVTAVASRSLDRAEAWAARMGVPKTYGSYQELIEQADVDAVYVPLPNSMHVEWTIKALEAGKHVLCEKPMATTAAEVDLIFDAAHRAQRLVMEGFMFRHHPVSKRVVEMVAAGHLGDLVLVRSWHGFTVEDPDDIRLGRDLGGGALNDLGCYCLAGTAMVLGQDPITAQAHRVLAVTGVDESTQALLAYGSGASAVLDCSMRIPKSAGLHIVGRTGQIEVPQPWFPHLAEHFWLVDKDGKRERIDCPGKSSYVLQLENFVEAIQGRADPLVDRHLSRHVAAGLELIASNFG